MTEVCKCNLPIQDCAPRNCLRLETRGDYTARENAWPRPDLYAYPTEGEGWKCPACGSGKWPCCGANPAAGGDITQPQATEADGPTVTDADLLRYDAVVTIPANDDEVFTVPLISLPYHLASRADWMRGSFKIEARSGSVPLTPICDSNPRTDGQPWESWEGNGPCHDCGNRNVVWTTDSATWRAVMGTETNEAGLLCPSCFIIRAFKSGVDGVWTVVAPVPLNQQTTETGQ
jgi:hypothetical protein